MSPGKNNLSQKCVVVQHVNPALQMGTVASQIVPSFKAAAPELENVPVNGNAEANSHKSRSSNVFGKEGPSTREQAALTSS